MEGGQTSLEIGLAAGLIAAVVGALYGAIAGYVGGWIDALMMRIIDALMSFPLIFLLIFLGTRLRASTKTVLILVIGLTCWFGITRLVRGEALTIKVRDYVAACRMMGGARPADHLPAHPAQHHRHHDREHDVLDRRRDLRAVHAQLHRPGPAGAATTTWAACSTSARSYARRRATGG